MDLLDFLGVILFTASGKELIESMRESKALIIIVSVGVTFWIGFIAFLFHMAGAS